MISFTQSIKRTNILGIFLVVWPIAFVYFFQFSCLQHKCSIYLTLKRPISFLHFFIKNFLNPFNISIRTVKYLFSWQLFQFILYVIVPGKKTNGRPMLSGAVLSYNCNGFWCFLISILIGIFLIITKRVDTTYFIDNITEFLTLSNIMGIFLASFVFIKSKYIPNSDLYFSGSMFYDFYCGVEHSPRIYNFDFKQFFNARVGIALWPFINICYAFKMKQKYGFVSNSMYLVNILQGLYVLDLFYFEDWYMRTIDIAHDHFGFYLAWGDLVWLPFMYTLQGLYLVYNPVSVSKKMALIILLLGLISIFLFRKSNNQKEEFREAMKTDQDFKINGKSVKFIKANYISADKSFHTSYLLADGFWGLSRHFNYLTDLGNALSYCLPCGNNHVLPYFYFIYMLILLLHRIRRDDERCKEKYGNFWNKYCSLVPYKLVPFIY